MRTSCFYPEPSKRATQASEWPLEKGAPPRKDPTQQEVEDFLLETKACHFFF